MPRFEIEANGQRYEIEAPDQQSAMQAFQSLQSSGRAPQSGQQPQQAPWQRGMLAPVERNEQTGELRMAWPQIALGVADAFKLPGETLAGQVPDLDPRVGAQNMSDETFQRVLNAGGLMAPGTAAAMSRMTSPVAPNAIRRFQAAMKDDQIPLNQVQSRIDELGPGAMAMDLGPNVQQRAAGIASVPGPGRQQMFNAVEARAKAAGGRVEQDVQNALGTGAPAATIADEIATAQAQASRPLYDAVRGQQIPAEGNIAFVMQTPMGQQAFNEAARMAANDGMPTNGLTIGLLDYAKRALDDIYSSSVRSGNNNQARQARELASILTREADQLVPEYAQAREAFAGYAAVRDALESGTGLFKRDVHPMEFARQFSEMTASERDALLQGARAAIEDQMGNAVNEVSSVRNLLRKPYNRQKLEVLLGRDAVDQLIAGMERELAFGETANAVIRNSQTAARQAGQAEAAPNLRQGPPVAGIIDLLGRAFAGARSRLMSDQKKQENSYLANLLTSNRISPDAIAPSSPWAGVNRAAPSLLNRGRQGVWTGAIGGPTN